MHEQTPTANAEQDTPKQPWQQELPPHERSSRLAPQEELALVGSWVKEGLEGARLMQEDDPDSDEYGSIVKTYEGALSELPHLVIDSSTGVFQAIEDRKQEILNSAAEQQDFSAFTATRIRHQRKALEAIEEVMDKINDSVRSVGRDPKDRMSVINVMIEQHNESLEATQEKQIIPEAEEAQRRIDEEREHAKHQPSRRPEQTVDEARKAVNEVFGATPEHEQQALLEEITRAAKGSTRLHTDIPRGLKSPSTDGEWTPLPGFRTFGDGLPQENSAWEGLENKLTPESLLFAPQTETEYETVTKTVQVETKGAFGRRKTIAVERDFQEAVGEVQQMVINPATGQEEPGVIVAYQFNSNQLGTTHHRVQYDGPVYWTENRRRGNMLRVEAVLPQSVADKLQQEALQNPAVAREFARLLSAQNGVNEEMWNNNVRPPYDETGNDWQLAVTSQQKDEHGYYQAAAEQLVNTHD